MNRRSLILFLIALILSAGFFYFGRPETAYPTLTYGISPYQDAILPRVAETLGWDKEVGLKIKTKLLPWEALVPAVATGAVDVAIASFDSFQAMYEKAAGVNMVFYYPFFIYKEDEAAVSKELKTYLKGRTKKGPVVLIGGLVTTSRYAKEHPEELKKLVDLWFRTVDYIDRDPKERGKLVLEDLNQAGQYQFSAQDYLYTWTYTNVYPSNPQEMADLLLSPVSSYYWRRVWQGNNQLLLRQKKIKQPVPPEAFKVEYLQ